MVFIIVGLLLIFVLPGAAITAAFFPTYALSIEKRILLTVGLSLATTVLTGLVLNLTPWGLLSVTWVAGLGIITLMAAAIALIRMRERRGSSPKPASPAPRLGLVGIGLLGLAGAVVLLAVGLARLPTPTQGLQGYSSLYLVPSTDGNPNDLHIGVTSDEFTSTTFQLQVKLDGKVVQTWNALDLKPGQSWDANLQLAGGQAGARRVEADLYRVTAPNSRYRHVVLVLTQAGS